MRVKIVGKQTTAQLREYLEQFVNQVERLGITHVTGTNIYFNPIDEQGDAIEIIQSNGEELAGWNYNMPKKKQKAKSAQVMSFKEQVEKLKQGYGIKPPEANQCGKE